MLGVFVESGTQKLWKLFYGVCNAVSSPQCHCSCHQRMGTSKLQSWVCRDPWLSTAQLHPRTWCCFLAPGHLSASPLVMLGKDTAHLQGRTCHGGWFSSSLMWNPMTEGIFNLSHVQSGYFLPSGYHQRWTTMPSPHCMCSPYLSWKRMQHRGIKNCFQN